MVSIIILLWLLYAFAWTGAALGVFPLTKSPWGLILFFLAIPLMSVTGWVLETLASQGYHYQQRLERKDEGDGED